MTSYYKLMISKSDEKNLCKFGEGAGVEVNNKCKLGDVSYNQ